MVSITCPACGRVYGAHFGACVHCNAPRPADQALSPSPPVATASVDLGAAFDAQLAAAPPPRPAPAPAPARPALPPKPECPVCTGSPGKGSIRMERREYQGSSLTGRRKWTVRWVDIPGVCAKCMKGLEIRRFAADVLCNVPFIVIFGLLLIFESKFYAALLILYALILFKWSWGLGYVWADLVIYGWNLDSTLARFEPPGDPGTTRFPAGILHCLVRLGFIPGVLVLLFAVSAPFIKPSNRDSTADARNAGPLGRARAWLVPATDIAVPVDPRTLGFLRDSLMREDLFHFTAYPKGTVPPRGIDYQLMTGLELLAAFLKTEGHEADLLNLPGSGLAPLSRRDAAKMASTLTLPPPATTPVLRSP